MRLLIPAAAALGLLSACASAPLRTASDTAALAQQVADTERAFAKTMADRDPAAFASFLASDAIFFSGAEPLRGKQAVADGWRALYEKPAAPFSWAPEQVEVLASGTLALSTGPVRDASGKRIATFNSIWRLEAPGVWRVVFDKGSAVCAP